MQSSLNGNSGLKLLTAGCLLLLSSQSSLCRPQLRVTLQREGTSQSEAVLQTPQGGAPAEKEVDRIVTNILISLVCDNGLFLLHAGVTQTWYVPCLTWPAAKWTGIKSRQPQWHFTPRDAMHSSHQSSVQQDTIKALVRKHTAPNHTLWAR